MALFRRKHKINWTYAAGEILLIFIGINLAIWFNNYNESNKQRAIEVKTLEEVLDGIRKDQEDIQTNITGYQWRVDAYRGIIDYLENGKAIDDSLRAQLPFIRGLTTFLTNTAPYETLKSRGMDLISNDSLRLMISRYYDLRIEWIQTNEFGHRQHYYDYIKPLILEHFNLSFDHYMEPLDYDQLKNNRKVIQTLYWAQQNDQFILDTYLDVLQETKELATAIETEVRHL